MAVVGAKMKATPKPEEPKFRGKVKGVEGLHSFKDLPILEDMTFEQLTKMVRELHAIVVLGQTKLLNDKIKHKSTGGGLI